MAHKKHAQERRKQEEVRGQAKENQKEHLCIQEAQEDRRNVAVVVMGKEVQELMLLQRILPGLLT